jgi:hypothetical protein
MLPANYGLNEAAVGGGDWSDSGPVTYGIGGWLGPAAGLGALERKKSFRLRLKCDGTRAETRFRLSARRTSPFKSAGASVQSTTDSRGVRISGSNAGYTMFRGSVKGTGYPFHSPVSPSLPLRASPCAITFQLDSTSTGNRTLSILLSSP